MAKRPKHARGEVERLLKAAERTPGVRVTGGGTTHYKVWSGDRMRTVSTTPSRGAVDKIKRDLQKLGVKL